MATTLANRRVLYISYNGMLDPLGQSQVIPYLKELSKFGVNFTLLSFERAQAYTREGEQHCALLRQELSQFNIEWHYLRYHQYPSLPATAFDVAAGIRFAGRLIARDKIDLVHARAHIPAVIALSLQRRFGSKMIFDVRGLMAEEYIDAGHWRSASIAARLTKTCERRALANADGIVTLTERIWPIINQWDGLRGRDVIHEVVPCCADLELFRFSDQARTQRRRELNLEDRFVVVYSGSIDGWYLTDDMADCFLTLRRHRPDAHFLWLTPTRHDRIKSLMQARGLNKRDYSIVAVAPRDVPSYLSASDAGVAFIKNCFSKLASSPTKYAEYLGCGLPLIINAGIGDSDMLVNQEGAGVLLKNLTEAEYARAAVAIEQLAGNNEQIRDRSRELAERLFDVRQVGAPRYARLYERVLVNREI
ncbi:MAG: glycosyltransferase [Pyrinomonadaceae bacterium]